MIGVEDCAAMGRFVTWKTTTRLWIAPTPKVQWWVLNNGDKGLKFRV